MSQEFDYAEEKLYLNAYNSSKALKDEIRQTVSDYESMNWEVVDISTEDSFVSLKFRRALN